METTLRSALLKNFLGQSPDWYKLTILIFLAITPLVFFFASPFIAGWLLVVEFIFTLAMALKCYPLLPGGLLALEAVAIGMTSPAQVSQEIEHNLEVLLLLIFMATAPIITQSVEVDLPDATDSKTVSSDDNPPVILEVSGVGQYTLVVDHNRMELLPPEQVAAEAKSRLAANPKTVFLIGGAKEVPYDEIIKALNILHQAGVASVGLMTQPI